ncbi:MAG: CYTH domain-containing protein [Candidatus Saccharibacteria bacterium]|nr:CYTH domain-containing protein [Candidatus Saccharibacteria bacterium]
MKKVIVKCKVASREKFEKKLSDIEMEFSPVYWQHDRVYVPKGYKRGINLPRLIMRTEMKAVDKPAKYVLLLKRHIEDSGIDISEETLIKDYSEMVNIILQLGFKPQKEVSRRRQEIKMGENTWMFLDNVDGTNGYFVKLETKLEEGDSVEDVKDDLAKTLAIFGEKNRVETSYSDIDF